MRIRISEMYINVIYIIYITFIYYIYIFLYINKNIVCLKLWCVRKYKYIHHILQPRQSWTRQAYGKSKMKVKHPRQIIPITYKIIVYSACNGLKRKLHVILTYDNIKEKKLK